MSSRWSYSQSWLWLHWTQFWDQWNLRSDFWNHTASEVCSFSLYRQDRILKEEDHSRNCAMVPGMYVITDTSSHIYQHKKRASASEVSGASTWNKRLSVTYTETCLEYRRWNDVLSNFPLEVVISEPLIWVYIFSQKDNAIYARELSQNIFGRSFINFCGNKVWDIFSLMLRM